MAIDSVHPEYLAIDPDWDLLSDCFAGERVVKSLGEKYLPATSGMKADGMSNTNDPGLLAYNSYKTRALFPDFIKEAVQAVVGIVAREDAIIELPKEMEALRDKATIDGEDLQTLLRKIYTAQFLHGRFGLLAEVPNGVAAGDVMPYIVTYNAKSIINWDTGLVKDGIRNLELVVLDESGYQRNQELNWVIKNRYHILITQRGLQDIHSVDQTDPIGGTYMAATLETGQQLNEAEFVAPSIAGRTSDSIPFVFVNTNDLVAEPDFPPLLGLANLAMAVYRAEADYRQALFLQGQETFVVIGGDSESGTKRVGAGAYLELPAKADAKYVGVNSNGLSEMRLSLQNDKKEAAEKGARLLDFSDASRQSGEALRIRVASKTATLTSVARTGAAALEEILKKIAMWMGADPEEVCVKVKLDFSDDQIVGRELLEWMQAKQMGAPISNESIHKMLRERGATDLSYEDELSELDDETMGIEGTAADDSSETNMDNNEPVDTNEEGNSEA